MPLSITGLVVASLFIFFGCSHASAAVGPAVTVVTTSIATAFSDCTCALTVPGLLTEYEASTTSASAGPLITTGPMRNTMSLTSVSDPDWGTTSEPTRFSLSICPTRIRNPTYTAPFPQPTDYTWGCPPRYLCQPDKKTPSGECNFEAGPPADTYYCSPDQCAPSPPLLPAQFRGASGASGEVGFFKVSPGYINLNPYEFGLDYDIFVFPEQSQNSKRELSVRIPGKCYDPCNDAMLEAESTGKTTDLCDTDADFLTLVRACKSCVASVDLSRTSATVLPQFQQYLFYCEGLYNQTASTSLPSSTGIPKKTTVTSASLQSTVGVGLSLTVRTQQEESSRTPSTPPVVAGGRVVFVSKTAAGVAQAIPVSAGTVSPLTKASLYSAGRISAGRQSSMAPTERTAAQTEVTGKERSSLRLPSSTPLFINSASLLSPCWTLCSILVALRLLLTL